VDCASAVSFFGWTVTGGGVFARIALVAASYVVRLRGLSVLAVVLQLAALGFSVLGDIVLARCARIRLLDRDASWYESAQIVVCLACVEGSFLVFDTTSLFFILLVCAIAVFFRCRLPMLQV
jgi:hypothetical protein